MQNSRRDAPQSYRPSSSSNEQWDVKSHCRTFPDEQSNHYFTLRFAIISNHVVLGGFWFEGKAGLAEDITNQLVRDNHLLFFGWMELPMLDNHILLFGWNDENWIGCCNDLFAIRRWDYRYIWIYLIYLNLIIPYSHAQCCHNQKLSPFLFLKIVVYEPHLESQTNWFFLKCIL